MKIVFDFSINNTKLTSDVILKLVTERIEKLRPTMEDIHVMDCDTVCLLESGGIVDIVTREEVNLMRGNVEDAIEERNKIQKQLDEALKMAHSDLELLKEKAEAVDNIAAKFPEEE